MLSNHYKNYLNLKLFDPGEIKICGCLKTFPFTIFIPIGNKQYKYFCQNKHINIEHPQSLIHKK